MNFDMYIFKSTISNLEVTIKVLPDDIIVNGELRRIVKDDNGEIPDWAKPRLRNHCDYMRITLDGKIYRQDRGLAKCNSKNNMLTYSFMNRGSYITRQVTHLIANTFDVKDVAYMCINKEYDAIIGKRIASLGYRLKGRGGINDSSAYNKWSHILHRCSDEENYKQYSGVNITGLFLVYEYFESWYKNNIYNVTSTDNIHIDKDILSKYERGYNENQVLLVPDYINEYFVNKNREHNGYILRNGKYRMYCRVFKANNKGDLGVFDTQEEAHTAWAVFKTKQLHEVVLPYFIEDVAPEDRNKPMVQLVINTLKSYQFR